MGLTTTQSITQDSARCQSCGKPALQGIRIVRADGKAAGTCCLKGRDLEMALSMLPAEDVEPVRERKQIRIGHDPLNPALGSNREARARALFGGGPSVAPRPGSPDPSEDHPGEPVVLPPGPGEMVPIGAKPRVSQGIRPRSLSADDPEPSAAWRDADASRARGLAVETVVESD